MEGEKWPISLLIEQLLNCPDIMPGSLCDSLGLPRESSVAQGVRVLSSDLAA